VAPNSHNEAKAVRNEYKKWIKEKRFEQNEGSNSTSTKAPLPTNAKPKPKQQEKKTSRAKENLLSASRRSIIMNRIEDHCPNNNNNNVST